MTLVYANIAISCQLLRFNSLKKHFPQIIYMFKRFENGLEKKFPDLNFFPDFGWKSPVLPDFPDWKKSSKFPLNSLIGGNPECVNRYTNAVNSSRLIRCICITINTMLGPIHIERKRKGSKVYL